MNTSTKGINISLTPAISDYITKRLDKINKLIGDDASVQCTVEVSRTTSHHHKGEIFRAEIRVVGSGRNIYATSEKEDLYMAIEDATDETLASLKSGKKKYLSFVRRGGATVKSMVKGLWPWK